MKPLKKEQKILEGAGEKLLSLALRAGADKAEVCAGFRQKSSIGLEKQDYHMASADEGFAFGLRVLVGKKQGFTCCNIADTDELKEIATRAVEIANFSPENPHLDIGASGNVPGEAPSELFDEQLNHLSLQTQKDWTEIMVKQAKKDSRFKINEGSVEVSSHLSLVMNSVGTHKVEAESLASWTLMGMGVDGDTITSFDYFQEIARKSESVPNRIHNSTSKFVNEVLANLQQGPAEPYKGIAVFSPRAVQEILLSNFVYHLNGRNLVEGTAKWKTSELETKVVSDKITIVDNPWLPERYGCSAFDREGTPTHPLTLIDGGQLKNWLMDTYSANALKGESTGHAAGSASSLPSVSPHSLTMLGGSLTKEELLKSAHSPSRGFLVVHRFSGSVDPVSGDFSGVAKGGEWWSGGARSHFVQETMISGNLFDSLGSALVGISKDTELVDCSDECPWLAIDQLSVTTPK